MWQLAAGFVAALFVLAGIAGFVRYSRPPMLVLLGLLLGVPTVGLAAYAIDPGPPPAPGPLLSLAFIPAVAGIAAGLWMLAWMSRRRASLTMANVELLSNGSLVMFGGAVLAIADLVGLWQPAYGIADVGVNAAWALVWVPRALRQTTAAATIEIRAPRARVYRFIAEPANLARWQEQVEAVSAQPAGALRPGSEVTVTQRYEPPIRGPRLLPAAMTITSVVDLVEPDRSISMHIKDRPEARSAWSLTDSEAGTTIVTQSRALAPYRLAVFGALLELRSQRSVRMARARRNLVRLQTLLEEF